MKILILGAGPTGLGAAWRLNEIGHADWQLLEANDYAGGLAASFRDAQGFFWDIGGHVQFSHYEYFDKLMHLFIPPEEWLTHQRESWVWMRDRFIPYPLQNNLRQLPDEDRARCLAGLVDLHENPPGKPENFRDWILATSGAGIADVFMLPYNFKVWAFPAEEMNFGWVGERVAIPDLDRVRQNLSAEKDDRSWGPNRVFHFPKHGGTGAIWSSCARRLPPEKLHFKTRVTRLDVNARRVFTEDGREWNYDVVISSLPIPELLRLAGVTKFDTAVEKGLLHSASNIIGIGLKGRPPESLKTKCWMYFPEDNCPFYRVTVFSNYSPHNVPDIARTWSLMAEISESPHKPVNHETLMHDTIQGLLNTRLIESACEVISKWSFRAKYGYPTPGLHRDEALAEINPALEEFGLYSRGRFGAWKYEVSNQDHSCMQGVEIAERLIHGHGELTFTQPNVVNAGKMPFPYPQWGT